MTTDEARAVAVTYRARFSDLAAFDRSWERFFDKTAPPNQSVSAAEIWLERDLKADQSRAAGRRAAAGLDDGSPQLPIDAVELAAIQRGDLHDFRNPMLDVDRHAIVCVRCQLGTRSRQIVDDIAVAADLRPFPGLGAVLERLYQLRRQRCDDCQAYDDEPATDECPRSFWHLPDIWLAIHPGSTLTDMGSLGPFMRGFLRRQRPVEFEA